MFNKENILDARFANEENNIVAVLYTDENGDKVEVYVEVNETDATYKALVEAGFSAKTIEDNTIEFKKAFMRNMYDKMKEEHQVQHDAVLATLEAERLEKAAELEKLNEIIALKNQEYGLAVAAIKALKEENNITSK